MDIKESDILGPSIEDHWYYLSKGRALRMILGGEPVDEVLDVGAGSGIFTRQLLDCGLARRGVCVDPAYDADRVEIHKRREIVFVRGVDEVPQKLVLMMDVLEHVDDDISLLREYTDRMPADGRVLITVPAFQMLWSGHDVFLEHRRRYTLTQIEKLVRQANLRVLKGRYFFIAARSGSLGPGTSQGPMTRAKIQLNTPISAMVGKPRYLEPLVKMAYGPSIS